MAIVLKNNKYNLKIDSNIIIGVIGRHYDDFFDSLAGEDICYLDKKFSVGNKKVSSIIDANNKLVLELVEKYHLTDDFFNRKVRELSHSAQKILKYILLVLSDKKIIIIDEPFIDLDYENKKRTILLINKLAKEKKTIIIGSVDSNVIYSLCEKVLFIDEDYYYDNISAFHDSNLLKKYHIAEPDIVKFVSLVKGKNINLKYSRDIRELIKDVYRNVSKK